ncbi:MAG: dethiobiotin synthase [Thermoguttaceae bacterium]|nr:dethiobiotin synthase [Thermoguttaceae bacterium]
MAKKLFVTGTGTDVGKTFVAGLIVKKLHNAGLNTAYYKCAASGNCRDETGTLASGDALWVKKTSGIEQNVATMCPYVYETAASPHLASRLEGNRVRLEVVKSSFDFLCRRFDYVVVEGSGGIVCPILLEETTILLEDVVRELDLSCLIVSNSGLGAINGVALTVDYQRARNIPIRGIVLNRFVPGNFIEEDNIVVCERITGVPVVGCVQENALELDVETEVLKNLFFE